MDCGVQSAMLSVPPVPEPAAPQQQQPLAANAVFAPPDTDQAQFEADKRAVYKSVRPCPLDVPPNLWLPRQAPAVPPAGAAVREMRARHAVLGSAVERRLQPGYTGVRAASGEGQEAVPGERTGNRRIGGCRIWRWGGSCRKRGGKKEKFHPSLEKN